MMTAKDQTQDDRAAVVPPSVPVGNSTNLPGEESSSSHRLGPHAGAAAENLMRKRMKLDSDGTTKVSVPYHTVVGHTVGDPDMEEAARRRELWDHARKIAGTSAPADGESGDGRKHQATVPTPASSINSAALGPHHLFDSKKQVERREWHTKSNDSSLSSKARDLDSASTHPHAAIRGYEQAAKHGVHQRDRRESDLKHALPASGHFRTAMTKPDNRSVPTAGGRRETPRVSDGSARQQVQPSEVADHQEANPVANRQLPSQHAGRPGRPDVVAEAGIMRHHTARRVSMEEPPPGSASRRSNPPGEERASTDSWVAVRRSAPPVSYPQYNRAFWKELQDLVHETEQAQRAVTEDSDAFETLQDELDDLHEMQRKLLRNSIDQLRSRARRLRHRFRHAEQAGIALMSVSLGGTDRRRRGSIEQPIMIEEDEDDQGRAPSSAAALQTQHQ